MKSHHLLTSIFFWIQSIQPVSAFTSNWQVWSRNVLNGNEENNHDSGSSPPVPPKKKGLNPWKDGNDDGDNKDMHKA